MPYGDYRFNLPEDVESSKCRGCGAVIYWGKTKSGKPHPCDKDGSSHFSSCPEADKFRSGKDGGSAVGMDRVKRLEVMVEHMNERLNILEGRAPKKPEATQDDIPF